MVWARVVSGRQAARNRRQNARSTFIADSSAISASSTAILCRRKNVNRSLDYLKRAPGRARRPLRRKTDRPRSALRTGRTTPEVLRTDASRPPRCRGTWRCHARTDWASKYAAGTAAGVGRHGVAVTLSAFPRRPNGLTIRRRPPLCHARAAEVSRIHFARLAGMSAMIRKFVFALLLVAVAVSTPAGTLAEFAVERLTIDTGGGHSSGGPYARTGTIGQFEAGTQNSTGPGFDQPPRACSRSGPACCA